MRKSYSKTGKILPNGVSLEKHEYDTVLYLTNLGYDVELVRPSNIPNTKSPDSYMCGKAWEMKSPAGKSSRTLEHAFKRATRQSENIILDLRRLKVDTELSPRCARKLFNASRRTRNLWITTAQGELLTFINK